MHLNQLLLYQTGQDTHPEINSRPGLWPLGNQPRWSGGVRDSHNDIAPADSIRSAAALTRQLIAAANLKIAARPSRPKVLLQWQFRPECETDTSAGLAGALFCGKDEIVLQGDLQVVFAALGNCCVTCFIDLQCSDLARKHWMLKSDPLIVVFEKKGLETGWSFVGRTELIKNELEPEFKTKIDVVTLEYFPIDFFFVFWFSKSLSKNMLCLFFSSSDMPGLCS